MISFHLHNNTSQRIQVDSFQRRESPSLTTPPTQDKWEPSPKGLFPHMAQPAPWALHSTALPPAPAYQPNPITEEVASIGRQPPSVLLPLHAALTLHDQLPAPHCSCCMSTMSPGRTHRFTDCMLTLQAAALAPHCHFPSPICKALITSTPLCIPRVSP